MKEFYTGDTPSRAKVAPKLPPPAYTELHQPEGYVPGQELVDAVNSALILGQPLLITGEPGVGKTSLAYSVAWQLGLDQPLLFETKSASVSRDLFYTYDAVGRLYAAQVNVAASTALDFITFNALGRAILRTLEMETAPEMLKSLVDGPPSGSVVLIDEIDKAPRDFPNDILNEIERLYFRIPEVGQVIVHAPRDLRPIVIMTSNSERHLPDAFLRRCVFYNIPFPSVDQIGEIIYHRLPHLSRRPLAESVVDFFSIIRSNPSVRRRPSISELLSWLIVLERTGADRALPISEQGCKTTLSVLFKTPEDQRAGASILAEWFSRK